MVIVVIILILKAIRIIYGMRVAVITHFRIAYLNTLPLQMAPYLPAEALITVVIQEYYSRLLRPEFCTGLVGTDFGLTQHIGRCLQVAFQELAYRHP